MSDTPPQSAQEEAERLYSQGLRVLGRSHAAAEAQSLDYVAALWQKARELYRTSGNEQAATQVGASLADLYKQSYLSVRDESARPSGVARAFKNWGLFLKVGCFGFGGPMAVFGLLEHELVEERKLLTDKEFLEGAVLGNVLPGPVTMDIVTYTGYKLRKWVGAAISTAVFILPSFSLMIVLAALYGVYSVTPVVGAVLSCMGAAVTGVILSVALGLSKTEVKGYREVCILTWAFAAAFLFHLDIILIVGIAGLLGIVLYHDEPEKEQEA